MTLLSATESVIVPTPIGNLWLTSNGWELTGVSLRPPQTVDREACLSGRSCPAALAPVVAELTRYFEGRRPSFEFRRSMGGTAFQIDVWNGVLEIPYGETISYAELARRIGSPRAVRAVGTALGRNPIPIIVPCHRVVGSSGLGGYGGGLDRKRWLLDHEEATKGATR